MKKTLRKLALRRETLRALIAVDLSRAIGGLDSADARCLATAAAATTDTHDAACPGTVGVVRTATG